MAEQIGPRDALAGSAQGVYSEPTTRRIRAVLAGHTIVDSTSVTLGWEHAYYPQYFVPLDDIAEGTLVPAAADPEGARTHDQLGPGRYLDVVAGDSSRPGGAWQYPEAKPASLRHLVRFNWGAADTWFEEEQEVIVHPRSPYVRIDTLASSRSVQVEVDGVTLASSTRPVLLFETGLPTRYYFPADDVAMELLTPTDTETHCPYKGTAHYWSAHIGDRRIDDVVWGYDEPLAESTGVAGMMCFYPDQVDLTVDGERLPQP